MAHQIVKQFKGIEPNVRASLPDEAEIVEFCEDGSIVCREPRPHTDPSVKEPLIDPETGEQAVREYETGHGTFRTKLWKWPSDTVRLVKFEPRKTGRVVRNFDFQESAEERAARERAEKVQRFEEELAEEFVEAGLTVRELARLLKDQVGDGETPEPAAKPVQTGGGASEPAPEGETPDEDLEALLDAEGASGDEPAHPDFELQQARPGVWVMPDETEFPEEGTAKKVDALAHIAEAYDEELALRLAEES